MKRVNNLIQKIVSDENLRLAIETVNKSHRWTAGHHPNQKVMWVETTIDERIKELRTVILNGFVPKPTKAKKRYDRNAGKWRGIHEPALWPYQYVHHALIQVLEPVLMRGMDYWCCGSIKGRGTQHGIKGMKRFIRNKSKYTKYCGEFDIRHFYDNLTKEVVMDRLKRLIKDRETLDLCERVLSQGVLIGAYFSQWFANTVLQPMDQMVRETDSRIIYVRYMDNITIMSNRKKTLRKVQKRMEKWLKAHGMELKGNFQIFPTKTRLPNAMGYRFGKGYTLIRKRALLTLRRQIVKYFRRKKKKLAVHPNMAYALLSRLGRLRHCNSRRVYELYVPVGLQKKLKNIVRDYQKGEIIEWSTLLELYRKERACA